MKLKKNPDVEVGRNSSLYFALGLVFMLLITYLMLEHKTYDTADANLDTLVMDETYDEEIPITNINAPPPPPPILVSENVVIVEDIEDVEESIIESTESSQEDFIEARIVSLEEVKVEKVEEDIEVPFAVIESAPIFPGCEGRSKQEMRDCFQEKIIEHIQKHFNYPATAKELGIHGKVFVVFVIDKNGLVSKLQSRGPDKMLEQEAERIISLLPKMTPGKQRGKPTKVPYSIPINFKYVEN